MSHNVRKYTLALIVLVYVLLFAIQSTIAQSSSRQTDACSASKGTTSGPQQIAFGEIKRGAIRQRGGTQSYTLQPVRNGDVVFVHLTDCSSHGGAPVSWKPCLALREASSGLVADSCEYGQTGLRGIRLQGATKYSISVSDAGDKEYYTGGDFALFIQRVNEPVRSQAITDGVDQTAFINGCGQIDSYHFEARTGDRIQLWIVAGSKRGVYPKMELYDPEGRFLDEAESYDGSGFHIPPAGPIKLDASKTGTHTVLVRSLFNDQGPYRLVLSLSKP